MARELDEQVHHDRIVKLLRRRLYNYPTDQHPNYMSYQNHPMKTKAIRSPAGHDSFPDIIVFWPRNDRVVQVAEVETESTVNEEEAKEWREFSQLGADFVLYVPSGCGAAAKKMCADFKVTELYEYWQDSGRLFLKRLG